jgi:hypothetical protein
MTPAGNGCDTLVTTIPEKPRRGQITKEIERRL